LAHTSIPASNSSLHQRRCTLGQPKGGTEGRLHLGWLGSPKGRAHGCVMAWLPLVMGDAGCCCLATPTQHAQEGVPAGTVDQLPVRLALQDQQGRQARRGFG